MTSDSIGSTTATSVKSGTSMSSPHTAGVAALYLQAHPTATPQQVRDAIFEATTKGKVTSANTTNNHLLYSLFAPAGGGNTPPTAANVSASGAEDAQIGWTPSVSDADAGATLTCSIASQPAHGSASVAANCSSGSYTPAANYNGADSFSYRVSDGSATDDGTVSVTVTAVNDAPTAGNDSYSTPVEHGPRAQRARRARQRRRRGRRPVERGARGRARARDALAGCQRRLHVQPGRRIHRP